MDCIKQKIIMSGKSEFLRGNYKDVSLDSICRAVGITTGAFYRRFKGKDDLLQAVIGPAMSELESKIRKFQIERKDSDLKEAIMPELILFYVFQYRDEFRVMLRHISVVEKEAYFDRIVRMLVSIYNAQDTAIVRMACKAYIVAIFETTLYCENRREAECCISNLKYLVGKRLFE